MTTKLNLGDEDGMIPHNLCRLFIIAFFCLQGGVSALELKRGVTYSCRGEPLEKYTYYALADGRNVYHGTRSIVIMINTASSMKMEYVERYQDGNPIDWFFRSRDIDNRYPDSESDHTLIRANGSPRGPVASKKPQSKPIFLKKSLEGNRIGQTWSSNGELLEEYEYVEAKAGVKVLNGRRVLILAPDFSGDDVCEQVYRMGELISTSYRSTFR